MSAPYANWASDAYYLTGDIVQSLGLFYKATANNIGSQPPNANWSSYTPPSQLPAGLFNGSWALNVVTGYAESVVTGVSSLLTSTSTLSCTLQTNTDSAVTIADQETHWLITCLPSSVNGGSITFIISGGVPASPSTFFVSWAVTKY